MYNNLWILISRTLSTPSTLFESLDVKLMQYRLTVLD